MSSCQRCGLTDNGPENFLLTCRGCRKTWHHRCLMPPMEDQDLIRLIAATTAGDTDNSLDSWTCRRCKKRASQIPSATSSREQTVSSELHGASKRPTSGDRPSTSSIDVRVKQETSITVDAPLLNEQERTNAAARKHALIAKRAKSSTANPPHVPQSATIDAPLVNERERDKNHRQEPASGAARKHALIAKRAKPSTANPPHVQPRPDPTQLRVADVPERMTDAVPQDKKESLPVRSHNFMAARKGIDTISTTSSDDDINMMVDSPPISKSASRATSQASFPPSSSRSESIAEGDVRGASSTSERSWGVGLAVGAEIQPPVNQGAADEIDDDPEDLYGPPVERRIIRILPSLAEELREQQRQVLAIEKEKRRTPLAPDWILARHANDPLWKVNPTKGRKRRKPAARKLGDNGLRFDELLDYYTIQNWVREHEA